LRVGDEVAFQASGAILETWVVAEILKSYWHQGRDALRRVAALERLGVPVGEGAVICLVPDAIPLNRSVRAVPIGWL